MIDECGPLDSYQDLKALVRKLIDRFLTWEKFSRQGMRSCPNLATASTADLLICPEAEPIVDLPNTYDKRTRVEEEDNEEEDGEEEGDEVAEDEHEVMGGSEEPEMVVGDENDTYLAYVKGWPE